MLNLLHPSLPGIFNHSPLLGSSTGCLAQRNGDCWLISYASAFNINDSLAFWLCIDPDIKKLRMMDCFEGSMPDSSEQFCVGMIFTDDNVGIVLGAVGSLSALVTMGVMIKLHYRKQERRVYTWSASQKNRFPSFTGATKSHTGNKEYKRRVRTYSALHKW